MADRAEPSLGPRQSQKHIEFISGPLGNKSVSAVPGIGDKLAAALKRKGIDLACVLVGQFLYLRRNEEKFKEWLIENCPANDKQQNDCCAAVKEWCQQHAN